MSVVIWAVAVVLIALGWVSFRAGVQQWHGAGRPLSARIRTPLLDAESLAGYDRGSVVFGVMCGFGGVMCVNAAVSGVQPAPGTAGFWVAVVGVVGLIATFGVFTSIMSFNRPKFLVPPHLRGQPGSIAGRRRRRHGGLPMH